MKNIPFSKNSILLAPMAGITDSAFRRICKKYGADVTVSEMISSKGIYYRDKKTSALMNYTAQEKPIIIQIFGSDIECMKNAAEYINLHCLPAAIDINMGCPAPKIFQNGDGCALMKDMEKAYKIITSVKQTSDFPVSVKFRSGIDSEHINAVEFSKMCQSAGADFITVHGRTRSQFYSGKSDIEIIKDVVSSVNIPVIANGDITDSVSAKHMLDYTGAYGIMIGRAALGNPFIFNKIKKELFNISLPTVNILSAAKEHLMYAVENKGEFSAVREFRKHLLYYLKGINNASKLKRMSTGATTVDDCLKIFELAGENI